MLYVRRSTIIVCINGVYGTSPLRLLFPAQLEQLIEIHSNLLRDMKLNGEDEIGTIFLHFLGSRQVGTCYIWNQGCMYFAFTTSCSCCSQLPIMFCLALRSAPYTGWRCLRCLYEQLSNLLPDVTQVLA